ncbi:UNVERIFIED_CONTAM: hypothetical protein K2H54_042139 [Gekko kuhli]
MGSEEEDLRFPDEPMIPVTTTLVTMVPVTTVTTVPVTTANMMTLSLLVYLPLSLELQGAEGGVQGRCQKASGGFKWSTFDIITQESWLLTPAAMCKSWYEYKPLHETGAHPQCREEKESPAPGKPTPALSEILQKGLLNARFDGTPEKLTFFMVQVEKFIHLLKPSE